MNEALRPILDGVHAAPAGSLLFAAGLMAALLLAILGAAMLLRHRRDPRTAARRLRMLLRASGLPHVRDVVIPDHVGGYTQVEYLLLTPRGIVLLEGQHYSGVIHGSAHAQRWVRFDGKRRHDFDNPFRRLRELAATLAALAPGAEIEVWLVVSGPLRFAKGIPDGALTLPALADALASRARPIPQEVFRVWDALLSRVACDPVAPRGSVPRQEPQSHAPAAT